MPTKVLPRTAPRDIEDGKAWYYVNNGSVDLVLREPNVSTLSYRLKRRHLLSMLSELRPLKSRRGR